MRKEKRFKWDDKGKRLVITQQEYIDTGKTTNIDEVKQELKNELCQIIQQVKSLKVRAEEIKAILDKLEEAGSIGPASQ